MTLSSKTPGSLAEPVSTRTSKNLEDGELVEDKPASNASVGSHDTNCKCEICYGFPVSHNEGCKCDVCHVKALSQIRLAVDEALKCINLDDLEALRSEDDPVHYPGLGRVVNWASMVPVAEKDGLPKCLGMSTAMEDRAKLMINRHRTAKQVRERFANGMTLSNGAYVIIKSLKDSVAPGGFNEGINLVQHRVSRTTFVQKLLPPEIVEQGSTREVLKMRRLKHPNIVWHYGSHVPDDPTEIPWIIMEYCNGGTLSQLLYSYKSTGKELPGGLLWHVFESLAKAIRYCHHGVARAGVKDPSWDPIYHRDINTNNVFFGARTTGPYESVKLADFGCALSASEAQNTEEWGKHLPAHGKYRPPEGTLGKAATDVYQLGLIMFCMINTWVAPMTRLYIPEGIYDDELEELVAKCLSEDPAERPDSMDLPTMVEEAKKAAGW